METRKIPWTNWLLILSACLVFSISCLGFWSASAQSKDDPPPPPAKEPQPLWGSYGLEICNTKGNTPQQNPRVAALTDGSQLIVWEDGRYGFSTIFAQKVDSRGNKLWDEVGVGLCRAHGNQNNAQLIDDGNGGAIIVWQGYCNGNADIVAQRLDARGTLLWGEQGVIVCSAEAGQFAPELATDGAGGAIIVWHDYRSGAGEDVYAQRLSSAGVPLWRANGLPVSAAAGTQWYPQIATDGAGGAYIAWSDGRVSSADNNIYCQRLDPAGKALWPQDGLPVCEAAQNQERPVMIATVQGPLLAWNDSRNGNTDIFAQKLNPSGAPSWAKDGVAVTLAPFNQTGPKLADDGAGGAVVAWTDNREEESAIYAQRLTADGNSNWEENGRLLAKAPAKQVNPELIKLKSADWLAVFEDYRKGYPLLFAQKINSAGVLLWQPTGEPVAPVVGPQEKPAAALTADGNCYLVWEDRRRGNFDLFSQVLDGDQGDPLLAPGGAALSDTHGSVIHQNVNLIDSGNGNIIMVFEDARNGFINIYAQKISSGGTLLWGRDGLPLAKIKADQINPCLIPDGAGGAIVAWEDQRNPNAPRIFAQRLSGNGAKVWEKGSAPVTKIEARQSKPEIIGDGAGGAIICWEDERDALSIKDIFAQRLSPKGELLWGKGGIAVGNENGEQAEAAMVADGAGGAIVAWTDYRRGERNPDVYAQRLNAGGKPLWAKDGVLVCGAPDIQRTPQVKRDGEGGAIISWTDKGGGSYDIYAQRLNAEGKTLWLTDGIPINQAARTQQNPQIDSGQILVWEDYRLGNWDIFANSVSSQGKLAWGEEGVPVVSLPLTQYAPVIAPWKGRGLLVAWEDYRNGKQYEIFAQKLSAEGRPEWPANGIMVKTTNGARAPKLLALPNEAAFIVIWEDYTGGGKAIFGQKFQLD
ncbi:MAG: hypothetical protein WC529_02715 [Candidatus Margulisiibacteriota bacterium]